MIGVFCFYGSHHKFIADQNSISKCMSGDLRHSGHWDAVIGEVLKEQRDGYQRWCQGFISTIITPEGMPWIKPYTWFGWSLSGCREKRVLMPVRE